MMNGSAPVSLGNQDAATGFACERGLDDGLHQAALGKIVRGRHQPVARRSGEHLGEQLLAFQVDLRRQPTEMVRGDLRPDRAVELVAGVAEQDQRLARFGARPVGMRRLTSSITPSTPTTGVGRIGVVPVWL